MRADRARAGLSCGAVLLAATAWATAATGVGPDRPPGFYPGDPLPPRTLYLTFDDGPAPWTADILDVLRTFDARATFFVDHEGTPTRTPAYPGFDALVRRIAGEGHALGNHTHGHRDLGHLKAEEIARELQENHAGIERALGRAHPLPLIRPSFGSPWMTATGGADVAGPVIGSHGLNVLWSLDSGDALDWVDGERYEPDEGYDPTAPAYQAKVRRIENAVTSALRGQGEIVLLHDTHPTTRDALPAILRHAREEGYRFTSLDQWKAWRFPAPAR